MAKEAYTQLVNPGKVALWNKETGERIERYQIGRAHV